MQSLANLLHLTHQPHKNSRRKEDLLADYKFQNSVPAPIRSAHPASAHTAKFTHGGDIVILLGVSMAIFVVGVVLVFSWKIVPGLTLMFAGAVLATISIFLPIT